VQCDTCKGRGEVDGEGDEPPVNTLKLQPV